MEKRFLLFFLLSVMIMLGVQAVYTALYPPPPAPNDVKATTAPEAKAKATTKPAAHAGADHAAQPPAQAHAAPRRPAAARPVEQVPRDNQLVLGSVDPASGFKMQVKLTNRGAGVTTITLTDKAYRAEPVSGQPLRPLQIVRAEPPADEPSFLLDLAQPAIPLTTLNWKVKDPGRAHRDKNQVVELSTVRDGLEIVKRYTLKPDSYALQLDVRFRGIKGDHKVVYRLSGPNGLPLENVAYTRTFRNVVVAVSKDESGRSVKLNSPIPARSLAEKVEKDEAPETFTSLPVRFAGVESQYFAVLVVPEKKPSERWIAETEPVVLAVDPEKPDRSNVSVLLSSEPTEVAQGASVERQFEIFAGPKQEDILASYGVGPVLNYGWNGLVGSLMSHILEFFHWIIPNYGIAIILLTVAVRLAMFPLSRKSTLSMQKMQALAPELKELQEKYKTDKEKRAAAQFELYRKHGVNPLGGCLPMVVQLPIFWGLYTALINSISLRHARFLWIQDLSAPDKLFMLPAGVAAGLSHVPWVGPQIGPYFNLLPILVVILMVVQQKMFTPPPTDEQQAMQYKMMNIMMVVFGLFFYSLPAGLCLYFIVSSGWGLAERKLLPRMTPAPVALPTSKAARRAAAAQEGKGGVVGWIETKNRSLRALVDKSQGKNGRAAGPATATKTPGATCAHCGKALRYEPVRKGEERLVARPTLEGRALECFKCGSILCVECAAPVPDPADPTRLGAVSCPVCRGTRVSLPIKT